jgi:hypothetical protein
MTSPVRFDHNHGKGAFLRLCSMLADPAFAYEHIGGKFGLTRQLIVHVATESGVDGKQRRHGRAFRVRPHVIRQFKKYPPAIQAVMDKLRRVGISVLLIPKSSIQQNVIRGILRVCRNGKTKTKLHSIPI